MQGSGPSPPRLWTPGQARGDEEVVRGDVEMLRVTALLSGLL